MSQSYFSGLRGLVTAPHHPLPPVVNVRRDPVPFVRAYNPMTDYAVCLDVFRETTPYNLKFEPAWTISSHLWCIPYLLLSPSQCFVLDDGTGCVVGYILGTASTQKFINDYEARYIGTLVGRGMPRREEVFGYGGGDRWLDWEGDLVGTLGRMLWEPRRSGMGGALGGVVDAYPSHLHINILPTHQRKGYGSQLISAFLGKIKEMGSFGAHIVFPEGNLAASTFFLKNGFRRFEGVLDGGKSWKLGLLEDGSVCFIREV